jgi:2-polyprenyl-6-methoxyphenol hydroxylase-like FAD-dependent oxidoreductase
MRDCDVLIVGAGPTGLVLALWLTKQGVKVRIVDRTEGPGATSRALAVQARTLELYRQLDLTEAVVERGHKTPAVNLWARGHHAARVNFETVGEGLTPYAFLHIFPQDAHETLLVERLAAMGVQVERRTELVAFTDAGDHVTARLRGPDGAETSVEAAYIAGCDGARSIVREAIGGGFPGGTYRQLFYVADVDAEGPPANGDLHIDLDEADFLAIFPLSDHGRVRLIGTVRDERADMPDLKFEDVADRAIANLKLEVKRVNWFSTYHVHHRVTERFRKGRAFVLGDAAHIHSPAGGQGMNTGIADAINLAWKLAAALAGRGGEALLDSYEAERIVFARRLVHSTDQAFTIATADGPLADFLRVRLAPMLAPAATSIPGVREFMFRTVSQITMNYRGGPLARGEAGKVRGGDRLPWAGGNFEPLKAIAWQAHVYGQATPALTAWARAHGVALHEFGWAPEHHAAGLARDAAYLVRPDTYVAVADAGQSTQALDRYLAEVGVRLSA